MASEQSKLVFVKAKGGMGNRMLCAATGLLYADLTGRRAFVDWRDASYSNDGSNVFLNYFPGAPSDAEPPGPPGLGRLHPSVWEGQLDRSMSEMLHAHDPDKHSSIRIHRKYSIDVRRRDYPEDVIVFWYYTQRVGVMRNLLRACGSPYAGQSAGRILRTLLDRWFRPAGSIQARIESFRRESWTNRVIGVHVRHTDRRTNLNAYERGVGRFLEQCPEAALFVATDNQKVLEDYRRRYPRVIDTPKWYPSTGSMHQNETCPDRFENGVEALVDMHLLASCDYLVYPGGSTFSWISRLMGDFSESRVFDIERCDPVVRAKRLLRELCA